ncbi:long-chain fatty alcohol dehydrogenase [Tothia fuscella]|uniref:Long-chain fatty alcohol dehydrogenase n=1 Tax=Tothia fuscella TaxID=1048955 RepID=A0A9P4NSQ1_9PEZI|nr:long-chain fatty alcohol dehydrogenase [Tothia fuscella]
MTEPELRTSPVAIKASPVPPLPTEDPLTKDQWRTLLAFADTVIPCIVSADSGHVSPSVRTLPNEQYASTIVKIENFALEGGQTGLAKAYLEERPSQLPQFVDQLYRFIGLYTPHELRKMLAFGLDTLNYRASAIVMTGHFTPFADQPVHIREQILQTWSTARIPLFRQLFKQLTLLVKQNWVKSSYTLYDLLNFPRIPFHGKPGKNYDFEFIQIPPTREEEDAEVLETDVVIVGSGCGSCVAAKNLAEAGNRVVVVDKSYFWPAEHLPMPEPDGWVHMFMSGGALFSDDSSTCVTAGQTFGGGGTVNWSASLQTQGFVRREWAAQGLPFFTSSDFQDSLDRVCTRMGVSTDYIKHNKSNDVLLEGARKLGWAAKAVPQNTGGKQHYCGYCTFGCGACEKQGPVVSFLPDAARAGCKFMEGFDVQKVLFDNVKGRKIAIGVEGTWTSRDENAGVAGEPLVKRKVIIKAKRVIISAGTMQSPLILLRSGLKNKWIGRNLRLHPVSFVGAIYDEEVRPWEGGILTAVVNEFENQDGKGHGTKLEAVTMMPTAWLSFLPWSGGVNYKLLAPRMKNMVGHFAIQRDTGSGRVYPDPTDGRCRYQYSPTKTDRKHIVEGTLAVAKINYIMGAREIFTTIPNTSTFIRPEIIETDSEGSGINCPTFNAWLDEVRRRGVPDPDTNFMSAHQMGTNKMAASPKDGVVDPKGRVWEVDEGLYVADASVFPSASGVNPMVTNMAISDWISNNIVKDLRRGDGVRAAL